MPDRESTTPKRDQSAYDRKRLERIKADPQLYDAYLDRKRRERLARQANKQYETERKRKWRAANRERDKLHHKAHHAVEAAINQGTLARPEACELCGSAGEIEAHHHLGYAQEHWLHVQWLCVKCHAKQHRTGFQSKEKAREEAISQ